MMTGQGFYVKLGGNKIFGGGWERYCNRRGRYPGDGNNLSGGSTSSPVVRLRIVGHVKDDEKEGGGNPFRIPTSDNGKEGMDKYIWDEGDTGGRRDVESVWDSDVRHIHRPHTWNGGIVGGSTSGILSLCMREGVQGKGVEEETMVAKRGTGGGSKRHAGGELSGGETKTETAATSHRYRERREKGAREMVNFQVDIGTQGISGLVGGLGIDIGNRCKVG